MNTEDRVAQIRATITFIVIYAICLAAALVYCHYVHMTP